MIINPQINNLKLTNVLLVILVIILVGFNYFSLNNLSQDNRYLTNENLLLEKEVSQLNQQNANLQKQLQLLVKSDRYLKNNLNSNSVIEAKITNTLAQNFSNKIDAEKVDASLKPSIEVDNIKTSKVKETKKEVATAQVQTKSTNTSLVSLSKFEAVAVKKTTTTGDLKLTSQASRTKLINVSFTLDNNQVKHNIKDNFYVQIVDPKNNVMGLKKEQIIDEKSIIYSEKIEVLNTDQNTFKVNIKPYLEKTFYKGNYFVNLYYKNKLIANTNLVLK
ncbi:MULTISPECIES: hypothetical protein [Mesoflavibacter]|uniref:hypothetical protein n=1 Tax=Mesoflavibacter TaxID=444051 RepID=UPI000D0FDC74|nr:MULTISPECIES: hypothetical protein [Mesoflavibacter]QIJ88679.1 hypothetical protein C7H62_0870 [Mesoflavibacter sp. HG96]QIJ91407.1 hypothetical protein C7H56_0870 [Mesoflavibacter sp. HG37]